MYATLEETEGIAAARRLAGGAAPAADLAGALPALVEQVCAEAGLWAPDVAERALLQAGGDAVRAVGLVRVWAAALPEREVLSLADGDIRLLRRLTAAYPEVPGGQWLGAAPELASRLLEWGEPVPPAEDDPAVVPPGEPPTRAGCPRVRELLADVRLLPVPEDGDGADPASASLAPPLDRATRAAVLARGETASLVSLAALVLARRREAVLAEVVGAVAAVRVPHPRTGVPCAVVEVPFVEAEAVVDAEDEGRPALALGWGASLGRLERRAIALALLDGALQADEDATAVAFDEQTIASAVDGSATNGFVEHLRLPHHASFASYLEQARP